MSNESKRTQEANEELVAVMLEPKAEKSDEDVLEWLQKSNVSDAQVLAPRFISATIPKQLLKAAEQVARVSPKVRKQTR